MRRARSSSSPPATRNAMRSRASAQAIRRSPPRACSRRTGGSSGCSTSRRRGARYEQEAMILAGDVGGTNVRLALFDIEEGRLVLREQEKFKSRELGGLEEAVRRFMRGRAP